MNIKSKFLNKSEIARAAGLSPQQYDNKVNGRGRAKPFNDQQLFDIEKMIRDDLNIPLENINPDTI